VKCSVVESIKVLLSKGKIKVVRLKTSNNTNLEKEHETIHMNEPLINQRNSSQGSNDC